MMADELEKGDLCLVHGSLRFVDYDINGSLYQKIKVKVDRIVKLSASDLEA